MTSIAPLRVAGFMEFQLFETVPVMDRTYCIFPACCLKGTRTGGQSPDGGRGCVSSYRWVAACWGAECGWGVLAVGEDGGRSGLCWSWATLGRDCVGEELADCEVWLMVPERLRYVTDTGLVRVMGFRGAGARRRACGCAVGSGKSRK
jgi:hypothetical protein